MPASPIFRTGSKKQKPRPGEPSHGFYCVVWKVTRSIAATDCETWRKSLNDCEACALAIYSSRARREQRMLLPPHHISLRRIV